MDLFRRANSERFDVNGLDISDMSTEKDVIAQDAAFVLIRLSIAGLGAAPAESRNPTGLFFDVRFGLKYFQG
jgi:hypothetical protein